MIVSFNHVLFYITIAVIIVAILLSAVRYKIPSFLPDKSSKSITDKTYYIIFGIIMVVGLILRCYHLQTNPIGIHCDEAGSAYDAYCIAHYGTDRFGFPYPVYFLNYGSGQNALYAYLLAPLIRIFGTDPTIYRLPAVFGGMLALGFGMLIMKECYGKLQSIIIGILITICPYFVMSSRLGLECMLLLDFAIVAIYFLLIAVRKQQYRYFILSGFLFGLCLYCYSLGWIILPIYLFLSLLYLLLMKKIRVKQIIALAIPIFIFALPLFAFIIINTFKLDSIVTPYFSILRLPMYRSNELSLGYGHELFARLQTMLTHDYSNTFSFKEYSALYYFSIPLVILGFVLVTIRCVNSIRKKQFDATILTYTLFIASISIISLLTVINQHRCHIIYYNFVFFLAIGIDYIIHKLHFKKCVASAFAIVYMINFLSFADFYYTTKQRDTYPVTWFAFDYTMELYEYLHDNNITTELYFDEFNVTTCYVAMLEYKVSPEEYMNEGNNISSDYCHYKNMNFYLPAPTEVDPECIYIVMNYNYKFNEYLHHCTVVNHMNQAAYGYYTIFYPAS